MDQIDEDINKNLFMNSSNNSIASLLILEHFFMIKNINLDYNLFQKTT